MKPSEFPGAIGFIEVPDESRRLGAFGVIIDRSGVAWAYDQETPRPITEAEIERRGGFRVKPEDVDELVDDVSWFPGG
ncbi:MAG: hypothetical protein JNN17_06045 [Verrucomicrobiaceae bacterium]|nr:hypothetical protein [Verrucomicrobiaceae bacterium]